MDMLLPVSIVQEQHLIQPLFPTQAMLIGPESEILGPARQQHPSSSPWDTPVPPNPSLEREVPGLWDPSWDLWGGSINSNCASLTGFPSLGYDKPMLFLLSQPRAVTEGSPCPCLWSCQASRNSPLKCWHAFSFHAAALTETLLKMSLQ